VAEQINALIDKRCTLTIRQLSNPAAENEAAVDPSA
jgi:hypothetical protein